MQTLGITDNQIFEVQDGADDSELYAAMQRRLDQLPSVQRDEKMQNVANFTSSLII